MNRLQRTVCHATNGALSGAILYLAFVPFAQLEQQPIELVAEAHR